MILRINQINQYRTHWMQVMEIPLKMFLGLFSFTFREMILCKVHVEKKRKRNDEFI